MTFNIRFKLFATLLLATGSVVLCMYLVMLWSFDRGFLDYINKQEEHKYQALTLEVAKIWQKDKGWKRTRANMRLWDDMQSDIFGLPSMRGAHRQGPRPDFGGPGRRGRVNDGFPREFSGTRRPPPFEGGAFGDRPPPPAEMAGRPLLLDRDKNILIGRVKNVKELKLYPVIAAGSTVGYVGQLPRNKLSDELDLLFVEQQSRAFMFVAFVMVIICVLAGLPIAAHLVKPIKHLTKGTQQLISGRFQTVIPVTSKDELGQLSQNFNSLANTLRENEKARQQWIADISHELRTPLAILKGEIEAIQDGIRQSTPEAIASLHSEVEHLNHLINDLYELSMSDIGALNYQKSKINPIDVLQATLDSFQTEFDNIGLQLSFNSDLNNGLLVLADGARLKQLFSNLLKNTLRYTDRPGKLEVLASSSHNEITLQFKDSSPGVSEEEAARLFDRLYRVESSRNRATGGAGLGLSICQNIVAAHDGKIDAKASPYGGVWVSIHLPIQRLKKDVKRMKGETV